MRSLGREIKMKLLFCVDKKDYEATWPHSKRPSVRGIIRKDNKLAMVHSLKYDYYKFPGGGIEGEEAHEATLIREVKEETGLTVKPETIREYGYVLRLQKSDYLADTVFEQENFYYTCEVSEETGVQKLDDYEAEEGFTLEFVTPEEAILANQNCHCTEWDKAMVERETRVLEGLKGNAMTFTYRLATPQDLERIWNKNIAQNPKDARWVHWKEEYIRYNKTGMAQTYVVVCEEEPVGECTLILSPECNAVRGLSELADGKTIANINALRITKEYEGKGHSSKLMACVEEAAKAQGINTLTIGVEAKETRNLGIYLHWGYDSFVMSETEDDELVLYYSKEIR